MNSHLQSILNFIQQSQALSDEDKISLLKAVKDADKELAITAFKLDRTEKVKRTTAILLEETIVELEQKRKAVEEQNRELAIESSLERVRAKALAMHKSEEIIGVIKTLRNELDSLNIAGVLAATIYLSQDDGRIRFWDLTTLSESEKEDHFTMDKFLPLDKAPSWLWFQKMLKAKEKFFIVEQNEQELDLAMEWIKNFVSEEAAVSTVEFFKANNVNHLWHPTVRLANGLLNIDFIQPPPAEIESILLKMGAAFDLAYKRFLDLQKAEAQARESQIELGLERVRARAMAMQNSDELGELVAILFEELTKLDLILVRCIIWIFDNESLAARMWMANSEDKKSAKSYFIKRLDHPYYNSILSGWREKVPKWIYDLKGDDKKTIDQLLLNETELSQLPEAVKQGILNSKETFVAGSFNNFGLIEASGPAKLTDEQLDILNRFGKVFDLSYTRFNDLKQAEAQARESQIQLALERVRARTMAMHKSDELSDVAALLFKQVDELGIKTWTTGFNVWSDDNNSYTDFITSPQGGFIEPYTIDASEYPVFIAVSEAKKRGGEFYVHYEEGEKLRETYRQLSKFGEAQFKKMLDGGFQFPTHQFEHFVFGSKVSLMFITYKPVPEAHDIFKRFGKVFEQTYTRFLDLQNAEAQAREAQIEAALERVRSRSMGMQKSEELREVGNEIYKQLVQLNFDIEGDGFILDYPETDGLYLWGSDRWGAAPDKIHYPYFNHPYFNRYKEAKDKGLDFLVITNTFEEKNTLFDHFFQYLPAYTPEIKEIIYASPGLVTAHVFLKNVVLYVWNMSGTLYSETENATLMRFGKVFEQAYIRFNDLKQAEAQALEAVKRASVDRVRAEIASMRTTSDLERIQPLIWNELKTLCVPFIRCGVFIMDEEKQEVQTMLSTPGGQAIATLHVPFEFDLSIITNGVKYWRKKKVYTEHWDAAAFTKIWIKLSSLRETSMDSTQAEHPPESLHLHMLPFLQGMLYVGSEAPLNDEQLQLVQNLTDAFSTAYARYEDFNKLEAAKKQVDNTLNELQVTQKQLIQSEKMASLGELTAGIAHEIQNPLNFVNNFSEVSNELLDEMKQELAMGNMQQAIELAEDVKQNLDKINHHGKRADGIVKGMLQHSRSSSAVKEPTDINKLADEYLRLAYHGLRAKDKSFNTTLKTDFDESIGDINIIPQDIGRVILNLINNAFYAVGEKKKQQPDGYEPTVSVSTKKMSDKVEIAVKDNGNGIPQKVLDKIFQPFFTTKPTGQGTGLGLSLSYDIVKSHGGEIKVNTKEGEGSEFIVEIPIKTN